LGKKNGKDNGGTGPMRGRVDPKPNKLQVEVGGGGGAANQTQ